MTIWLFLETSISWMLGCSKIFGCRKNQPHGFSGKGFGLCCDTWPSWMVPWVTTWWQVLVMGCEWWQVVKWISKSSDHPKTFKWMFFWVYHGLSIFLPDFFFRSAFGPSPLQSLLLRHHNCKRQLFVEAQRSSEAVITKAYCFRLAEMSTHMWEYMPWNAVGISRSKVVFSWNVIVGWAQSRAKEKNIIIDFFTSTCFVQHSARESADLIPTTWPTFRPDIGAMKKHEGWSKIVEYHEKFDCGSILLNEGKNVMRKNGMGSTRIFLPTRMVKFYIREPIRTFPPTYSQKKNMCFLIRRNSMQVTVVNNLLFATKKG